MMSREQSMDSAEIRILVVDDHPLMRRGLCQLLKEETGLSVVGEAEDGARAVELATELQPDVVIMDVAMPGLDGVEAAGQILKANPQARILILSGAEQEAQVLRALKAGARGYVLKIALGTLLIKAVRLVADGGTAFLQPEVTQALLPSPQSAPEVERVSDREIEILEQAGRDLSNKEIGARLGISERTVQQHLANIFGKLAVSSRTGAVLQGLRRGWLQLERLVGD